ncbi:MAG: hypothetical protein R2733_02975 [Acidimicrobiales bacterium]
MPSASDFDAAATALTKAAAELTEWMVGTRDRFGPDTISGGALTQVCHQAVDEAEQLATSTAEALRSQAALCRQRAAAVRSYEAALGSYQAAMNDWRDTVNDLPSGVAAPAMPIRPAKPGFAP